MLGQLVIWGTDKIMMARVSLTLHWIGFILGLWLVISEVTVNFSGGTPADLFDALWRMFSIFIICTGIPWAIRLKLVGNVHFLPFK